jgi:hypothetical protein
MEICLHSLGGLRKVACNSHASLEQLFVASMQLEKSSLTMLQEGLGESVKILNLFARNNVTI